MYFFVIGGLLLDLLIVPCLLWRRTRILAFCGAALFHLLNSQLFHIGIFPWLMLGATFIFFPPDTIRHLLHRTGVSPDARTTAPWWQPRLPVAAAVSLYLAFQVLMPLRHFLYPGDVHWTEEGHRFSWHMKLRTKSGDTTFELVSPATGRTWEVDPLMDLSDSAYDKMATHPDMILQYAHRLADQKRREGYPDIEVRARSMVSLNGRPRQALIDAKADLAKQPRSLRHAPWVLPLTEALPRSSPRGHEDSLQWIGAED